MFTKIRLYLINAFSLLRATVRIYRCIYIYVCNPSMLGVLLIIAMYVYHVHIFVVVFPYPRLFVMET